jgi:hypothetical protein
MQAWDLLESKKLFTARDEDGDLYDAAHLAQYLLYCRSNIPCSSQKSAFLSGFLARNSGGGGPSAAMSNMDAGLGPSGVKKAVYSP